METFSSIASYYEVLSDNDARLQREGPLLLDALQRAPGRRVVDLACGTGLHAAFFAEHGARVSAFDLSEGMIAFARERRPHPAIAYAVGDMSAIKGGPWDLTLCLGNSMSLLSHDAMLKTFCNVSACLEPGGLIVLQVLNYASDAARAPRHRVERRERDGVEIVAVKSLVPHAGSTLLSLAFFASRDGRYESATDSAVLTHLGPEDIAAMAGRAGLEVDALYGAFDCSAFVAGASPDLIAVLRKPL